VPRAQQALGLQHIHSESATVLNLSIVPLHASCGRTRFLHSLIFRDPLYGSIVRRPSIGIRTIHEEAAMATIEFWIQIENHPWDVCPTNNTDRMTGSSVQDVAKASGYQIAGAATNPSMNFPLKDDALILRRYTANWQAPDDRKVNPWDLNEPDPSTTLGTIPGPVLECNVGDKVIVHFRNKDQRTSLETQEICIPVPFFGEICFPIKVPVPLPVGQRTHSLHTHGFAFAPTSDGAYPLTPPDSTQPIDAAERAEWDSVKVTGPFKQGDRVPPDATFTYTWIAGAPSDADRNVIEPWPTTSGVWLYHDHSICDTQNVQQGAIGLVVIHNPDDPQDVIVANADLPGGSPNGSPIVFRCFPFPFPVGVIPPQLGFIAAAAGPGPQGPGPVMGGMGMAEIGHAMSARRAAPPVRKAMRKPELQHEKEKGVAHEGGAGAVLALPSEKLAFELDRDLKLIKNICLPHYRTPPDKAQYVLLFHNLGDAGMCINGRKYLGNTPSVVARAPDVAAGADGTLMRFGVVAMGNTDGFHTFHLHGHRWMLPGPDGNMPGGGGTDPADGGAGPFGSQFSPQIRPVSQFEDTRTFGPANSFVFTIQQGQFTGAIENAAVGEWHMHCHVLTHMMDGMMGSLVVRHGGELALFDLPSADPTLACPMAGMGGMNGGGGGGGTSHTINAITDAGNPTGFSFNPSNVTVNKNDTVVFHSSAASHSIVWDTPGAPPPVPTFNSGTSSAPVTLSNSGTFNYHCGIHGPQMNGTIKVN
jgi:FtsP/CotA-like multicopper oxidase with cupredoxin domain/plastocyanin